MVTLAKHLWQQLLYDADAAKIRLAAAKTAGVAFGLHILAASGGDIASAFTWSKKQWAAAALTAAIGFFARASDSAGAKPAVTQP